MVNPLLERLCHFFVPIYLIITQYKAANARNTSVPDTMAKTVSSDFNIAYPKLTEIILIVMPHRQEYFPILIGYKKFRRFLSLNTRVINNHSIHA